SASQLDGDRDCDRIAAVLAEHEPFLSQGDAQSFVDRTSTQTWEELFGPGSEFEELFGPSDEEQE
ncbi:MAG: hypothetical protein AB4042_11640, partial [Leptolyngbyaceae cyanobacterium]